MEPVELLEVAAAALQRVGVRYLITGSVASTLYGEPRYTNDIDIVAELREEHVAGFCRQFPADRYYLNSDTARDAVRHFRQFNIIHPTSGLEIDVIVASHSEFDQLRLARGRLLPVLEHGVACFASPEDVILKKLQFFREGRSDKHIRDIVGILRVQGDKINREYIDEWVLRLELAAEWSLVLSTL